MTKMNIKVKMDETRSLIFFVSHLILTKVDALAKSNDQFDQFRFKLGHWPRSGASLGTGKDTLAHRNIVVIVKCVIFDNVYI